MTDEKTLILASGSPRRREVLERLGYAFTVRSVDIDETPRPDEPGHDYVERLAREKAQAETRPGEVVLAADTVVVLDGQLLGKPRDADDATAMIHCLAGRKHQVSTGIAVLEVNSDTLEVAVETTTVRFAPLKPAEVAWYVASGEPMDKAGAYAIQGLGSLFVEAIEGNYSNVVGLPVPRAYRMLTEAGVHCR